MLCSLKGGAREQGGAEMDRRRGQREKSSRVSPHSYLEKRLSSFSCRRAPLLPLPFPSSPFCWNECLRIREAGTGGPQDWDWD